MRQTVKVAPSNSVILVMDRTAGYIPEGMGNELVVSTPTCIAVGTLSEHDGETSISLSDEGSPSGFGPGPKFDGVLKTPSKNLAVCSVLDEVLLETRVPSSETHVQVWANDDNEPNRIAVVLLP